MRDSANGGFAAANGKTQTNDGIGGIIDISGISANNFADFRKQQLARLLSHIDNTLAAQGEKAITDNFAAVRRAQVHLQTGLGGRTRHGAINLVGSVIESDTRAVGWQLRAYGGGEDGEKGANAGVFFRSLIGQNAMWGANVFTDYEDGDYGAFSRFGVGGELKSKHFSFGLNYYAPLSDTRRVNANVAAFSRKGFDAGLRFGLETLKARADYYYFHGKENTDADEGYRYGLEWQAKNGFRLAVYYDDGAEKLGGDVAYIHNFDEPKAQQNAEEWTPDLFAPVEREYSQRIATLSVAPQILGFGTIRVTIPAGFSERRVTLSAITTMITVLPMTQPTNVTTTIAARVIQRQTLVTPSEHETEVSDTLDFHYPSSLVISARFSARYDYILTLGGTHSRNVIVSSTQDHRLTLPFIGATVLTVANGDVLNKPGHDFLARVDSGSRYGVGNSYDYRTGIPSFVSATFLDMPHTLTVIPSTRQLVNDRTLTRTVTLNTTPAPQQIVHYTVTASAVTTTLTVPPAAEATIIAITTHAVTTTTQVPIPAITITTIATAAINRQGINSAMGGDDNKPPSIPPRPPVPSPKMPKIAMAKPYIPKTPSFPQRRKSIYKQTATSAA